MENKLINAVRLFPCLFDKSKKDYRNKLKKEMAWASVATAAGATVTQCQSRWRSLRDRYVREIQSVKQKSGNANEEKRAWCYLDAMSFLQTHVEPQRKFSKMDETENVFILEESSFRSLNTSSRTSTCYVNDDLKEEEIPVNKSNRLKKRCKVQKQALDKFDELCGTVSNLIATKKEESRNADFFKVLDSYLLKHSEEKQDRLKIEILNLFYQPPDDCVNAFRE